ncbi:MAG: M50 family metallopeptidase [Actinomycetota bacterium]
MTNGGWRIGRIAGVELRVDPSLAILAALIAYNTWIFLESRFPELGGGGAVALAALTAALFEVSILAHELAHAVMARLRGYRVLRITLHMLGGFTWTEGDRTPRDEFLTTGVGPVASAGVGMLFLAVHAWGLGVLPEPVTFLAGYLGLVNLIMAAFNLLPGFPMDGGRLLLAGLWRILGDRVRATRIAARVGQGLALAIVAGGLWLLLATGDLWGLWPALIGWSLFQGASATMAQAERSRRLESATAADVMSPPPPTVPADMPLASALERYLSGHDGEAFPVMDGGHVTGFISLRLAGGASADRTVREAMAGALAVLEADPAEPLAAIAERMSERRAQAVMVVRDGRLVGVIEPEDLDRFLRSRGAHSHVERKTT